MIICICHRVSDRDIAHAVRQGCKDFDSLQGELCVATACGACHEYAQESFQQLLAPGKAAPPCAGAARHPSSRAAVWSAATLAPVGA